jgi:hypothetical protein
VNERDIAANPDAHIGHSTFIPSSHIGGPRYFTAKKSDLTFCAARYGTNNMIFLTVTLDPQCDAVKELIAGGVNPVVAQTRVMESIRQTLQHRLTYGHYLPECIPAKFRRATYYVNVTEWQGRGLPHIHIIVKYPGPLWTADIIDLMFFAHRPTPADEAHFPGLTELVERHHIHAHTARCQKSPASNQHSDVAEESASDSEPTPPAGERRCSFGFPFPPNERTVLEEDGSWRLWRGAGDAWLSAYMPAVLCDVRAHSHGQAVNGTRAVGYLLGYPLKGDAHTYGAIREARAEAEAAAPSGRAAVDEVNIISRERIMGSSEAAFRIFGYSPVINEPPVDTINVQLPGCKIVYYNPQRTTAAEAAENYHSHVEKFFGRPPAFADLNISDYFGSVKIQAPTNRSKARAVPLLCCPVVFRCAHAAPLHRPLQHKQHQMHAVVNRAPHSCWLFCSCPSTPTSSATLSTTTSGAVNTPCSCASASATPATSASTCACCCNSRRASPAAFKRSAPWTATCTIPSRAPRRPAACYRTSRPRAWSCERPSTPRSPPPRAVACCCSSSSRPSSAT